MQIGFIGLDPTALFLIHALQRKGYRITGFDPRFENREEARKQEIQVVQTLDLLAESIASKRVIWTMIPSPEVLDEILITLQPYLAVGDIVIDASHSFFRDTIRRAEEQQAFQIDYLDCGISGSTIITGESIAMIGGNKFAYLHCQKILHDIFGEHQYTHCGKSGSGQFVQDIHQKINPPHVTSIAKGIAALIESEYRLDLVALISLWNLFGPTKGQLDNMIVVLKNRTPLEALKGISVEEKIENVLNGNA